MRKTMAKKNANNAIDFSRLQAVRDQLSAVPPLSVSVAGELPGEVPMEAANAVLSVTFAEPLLVPAEPELLLEQTASSPTQPEPQPPAPTEGSALPTEDVGPADHDSIVLRIGMSRPLHERIRAASALACKAPASLARELLLKRTPEFPRSTPMTTLAKQARDAFPTLAARPRVDVRMQVPLEVDLHRRLHQLAALRTQTLVACLSELFEASVSEM
jgi:hypothetical protein